MSLDLTFLTTEYSPGSLCLAGQSWSFHFSRAPDFAALAWEKLWPSLREISRAPLFDIERRPQLNANSRTLLVGPKLNINRSPLFRRHCQRLSHCALSTRVLPHGLLDTFAPLKSSTEGGALKWRNMTSSSFFFPCVGSSHFPPVIVVAHNDFEICWHSTWCVFPTTLYCWYHFQHQASKHRRVLLFKRCCETTFSRKHFITSRSPS